MKTLILAATALAISTLAAPAQQSPGMHNQMQQKTQHHGQAQPSASPSTKAFKAAGARMHKDMQMPYTGDADVDFVKHMIPHHQGAIEAAKIVLEHGKDAETRKMAQEIITAQEKEITQMREWLKTKGQ